MATDLAGPARTAPDHPATTPDTTGPDPTAATPDPTGTGPDPSTTFSGLDALELADRAGRVNWLARLWRATWPKLLAVGIVIGIWQAVVVAGWKPEYVLPPPLDVWAELRDRLGTTEFWHGILTTSRRAAVGFGLSTVLGLLLGVAVARIRVLRAAIGSMITSLQTMPSIAWFPLAILLFQLNESAILFVVVLGATPSIANGVITGVDYVPPLLLRAGRNIGASGFSLYRYVIAPASLPSIVAGLKQGWAFAWRSLMAGELLVAIRNSPSLGFQLESARQLNDAYGVLALLIVVFVFGILVDVAFSAADRAVRRRWGVVADNDR